MSLKIAAYMQHLADSAAARAEFQKDKTAAMTKFGLNAEDQAIVASGDHARIRAAVASSDQKLSKAMPIVM